MSNPTDRGLSYQIKDEFGVNGTVLFESLAFMPVAEAEAVLMQLPQISQTLYDLRRQSDQRIMKYQIN